MLLGVLLACLAFPPGLVSAHADLLRADPPPDAILPASPNHVRLWFSENLNDVASRIVVWNRYRQDATLSAVRGVPGQPRAIDVDLKPHLPPGSYLVIWTSVSAEDGHLQQGSYVFSVRKRGPGPSLVGITSGNPGQSFPDPALLTGLMAHWIELLSVTIWVGGASFSAFLIPPLRERLAEKGIAVERQLIRKLLIGTLILALLSSSLVTLYQALQIAGNDPSAIFTHRTMVALFADQFAHLWVGRQFLIVLALVFTLTLPANALLHPGRRYGVDAIAISGFVYLYLFAASGHAASAHIGDIGVDQHGGSLTSVSIIIDWLHFLADALWFGGQFYVVLVLIPTVRALGSAYAATRPFLDALNRFSPTAYVSVFLFTVSGGFAGKIHIPSWYAFFNSVYGRTLIVKMALIGLMILTSAYTVYILRPRVRRLLPLPCEENETYRKPVQRLINLLHINPVLGSGVLLATSVMFYYPVPTGFGPTGPSTYTVQQQGLSATVMVDPNRSGPNTITVALRDAHGVTISQARIVILTKMLDMPMGTGLVLLSQKKPGTYTGSTDLGMGGHWGLQLLVYRPSGLTHLTLKVQIQG